MREMAARSLSLASYNYQREVSEAAGRTLSEGGGVRRLMLRSLTIILGAYIGNLFYHSFTAQFVGKVWPVPKSNQVVSVDPY